MKYRTTKDLLLDLANLDISKESYVVCSEWSYLSTTNPCQVCNGEGFFYHGNNRYSCLDCDGTGKEGEKKDLYVVRRCTYGEHKYPEIQLNYNTIEMPLYYDIQGFFNDKEKAQALADELNKDK